MALTYRTIAIHVRNRLKDNIGDLRLQSLVGSALQRLADAIAEDEFKRDLLYTPRSVTGTPSGGALDLTSLITSSQLLLDKIELGNIYVGSDTRPMQWLDNNQFSAFKQCWANTTNDKFVWVVGNILYTKDGVGNAINSTLQFQVPRIPTVANLPFSLEDELLDEITQLALTAGQEGSSADG